MGRILIVEDELVPRQALLGLLAGHGYEVLEAENGRAALEVLAQNRLDLVITDIVMPELDGLALLNRMRRDKRDEKVIVLSNSGYGLNETFLRLARMMGAVGTFRKPFDPSALLRVVVSAVAT